MLKFRALSSAGWLLAGLLLSGPVLTMRSSQAAPAPPLIPREVLFGNPEIVGITLSPDGKQLAYLAPFEGVLNLWVRDLDGSAPPRRLTGETERPQNPVSWSPDGRYLLSSRDHQGDENSVLVRIDPRTGAKRDLTPSQGVRALVAAVDRDVPDELVVATNERDKRFLDYYVLNLETGERRLLYQSDDGRRVTVQRFAGDWHPVLRGQVLADGGSAYELRMPGAKRWSPFLRFSFEDTISGSGPGGFTRDGQWLYGVLSTGENLPRIVRWHRDQLLTCGTQCPGEVIHRSASGSVIASLADFDTGHPKVLIETDLRSRRIPLDAMFAKDLAGLKRLAAGREFVVMERDRRDRLWLVAMSSDQSGPEYWLWDRQQRDGRRLFAVQPKLESYALVPMESLSLKARDGRRLPAYLTRTPLAADAAPQPLVLLVHGGPQARDVWGLDPMHQLLANRGYHVLSVNYRGSTGFGKDHLLAGEGEWYGRMQDDLVDAVQWAVQQGLADPDRLAIMGASYGGYAALSGLTRDPELFAAAVAQVAPSNVRTLLETIPPYWESQRAIMNRMIGVGSVDLASISPISHVDRIQRPLLLAHGANDPRVKLQESESIAAAMARRKLPIDFVVFPDEGHSLSNPRNGLAMTALIELFLQQHLGGRAQPPGEALKASSLEWRLRSLRQPLSQR